MRYHRPLKVFHLIIKIGDPIWKIANQTWMAENLNYDAKGSVCYDNNPANCEKYGRLYNWETAMKVCPSGWHLPSTAEWEVMTAYICGAKTEGKKLKSKSGWNDYKGESGNGTDEFGFSALPGGAGGPPGGFGGFGNLGNCGTWWSANEGSSNGAYSRYMCSDYAPKFAFWDYNFKHNLYSVRCLKD